MEFRDNFHAGTLRSKMVLLKTKNRHVAEVARALMTKRNMPHCYWAKVVSMAVYIMNKTTIALVHNVTPKEKFLNIKLDLSHLINDHTHLTRYGYSL